MFSGMCMCTREQEGGEGGKCECEGVCGRVLGSVPGPVSAGGRGGGGARGWGGVCVCVRLCMSMCMRELEGGAGGKCECEGE